VALAALCVCACLHLRSSYRHDASLSFYAGCCGLSLLGWLAYLVEPMLRRPVCAELLKRLTIVSLLLPLADGCYELYFAARNRLAAPNAVRPVFSFSAAQGNPDAFALWWRTYLGVWHKNKDKIQRPTPNLPVPYEFIPNSEATFFDGTLHVNSHGFVGPEFSLDKQDHYRIVAMGSSHTEGPILAPGDDPWPQILGEKLAGQFSDRRPVEVINAGATAYYIENNLYRLVEHVLPLEPDMIITYFGYNNFKDYADDFEISRIPAEVKPRASRMLSKVEYNFRDWLFRCDRYWQPALDLEAIRPRLLDCGHGRLYRQFIDITREHGIRLVICNFNMAVTHESPEEVVEFYELGFPNVRMCIDANRINSELVAAVAEGHPHVMVADVQAGLNGEYEGSFVDLVHMTYRGKSRLAQNVLEAITPILEDELGRGGRNYDEQLRPASAEFVESESDTVVR
jgi:hypothetical protein